MKTLIGIIGRKGVGKSTLAEMLKQEIEGAEIIAFADALRGEVHAMLNHPLFSERPVSREWLEERKGSVWGPILQGYGEFCRQWYGPSYWIDVLANDIEDFDAVIVPDVRHVNEAEFIKSQGGLLVAIDGPSRWVGDQRDQQHPSEANVDKIRQMADVVVFNMEDGFDTGFDDLRRQAMRVANIAKHLVPELVTP